MVVRARVACMAMPMTAVAHGVTCGIELLLTEYKKGQIGHFAIKANALFAYIQTFTYLYALIKKCKNKKRKIITL
jgi:succinate dehydrogenase/fumarate reductase cytochrome b subunit